MMMSKNKALIFNFFKKNIPPRPLPTIISSQSEWIETFVVKFCNIFSFNIPHGHDFPKIPNLLNFFKNLKSHSGSKNYCNE